MSTASSIDTPSRSFPLCTDLVPPERVSDQLKAELFRRALPDDPATVPRSFDQHQLDTLRAMVSRILPDAEAYGIDIALRLDAMMADQEGNGWRYEALPTDPDAYRAGLDTLNALAEAKTGQGFDLLPEAARDELLETIGQGNAVSPVPAGCFDAEQMKLWFEEVRSDAVRHYVAHPAIMARIGYSGFANGGGTGSAFQGFEKVGIDEREAWEPEPVSSFHQSEHAR